jgi:hypothetical protein
MDRKYSPKMRGRPNPPESQNGDVGVYPSAQQTSNGFAVRREISLAGEIAPLPREHNEVRPAYPPSEDEDEQEQDRRNRVGTAKGTDSILCNGKKKE